MEEKTNRAAERPPRSEPPPLEAEPARLPREETKERGPLWVKAPPPGVELRGFLRIMLNG